MGLEDWLDRGISFMKMARLAYRSAIYNAACFNAHQAAEMLLKGLIVDATGSHPFTHSLTELLDVLRRLGRDVPDEVYREAEWLEPHYVLARYPARGVKPYGETTAARCISAMDLIAGLVERWSGKSLPRE
ncbi:HEPN domain protein [Thermoproteus uzoniensis 768-20]|uniref:HEPN domain protein n=1 Tax=Thermoproteus uzoniensis (strain 768-20) TaxID=999630 RepID=F2L125_THEU7|nr:HEPN domain-containing protein [Thermoproteus uzoniensis]AEA11574.1 HEPN domain protein [Thermoproteus uzoniensis 768-20]